MPILPDTLLAGAAAEHEVVVPPDLLGGPREELTVVRVRPLTVGHLQLIQRAAGDDPSLSAALMVHYALTDPRLSVEQVQRMPAGLAAFLVDQINLASGTQMTTDELSAQVREPVTRALLLVAEHLHCSLAEASEMTMGQVLLCLEMMRERRAGRA